MELEPFTRIVWKSRKDKEIWSDRLSRISSLFHKIEFKTFLMGMRSVYTYHASDRNMESTFKLLKEEDLIFIPLRRSKVYSGFSHKHITPKPGDPQYVYGVLAKRKNRRKAELFAKASEGKCDHKIIGKLLGYPDCCCKFFKKIWGPVIDPIFEQALNTEGAKRVNNIIRVNFHPYCNQTLRYFGFRITPHLPCSGQCKETIEWGDKWFNLMKREDKLGAKCLYELLSMPSKWDCFRGIAIVDTPIFRGITNSDFTPIKKIVINKGWR